MRGCCVGYAGFGNGWVVICWEWSYWIRRWSIDGRDEYMTSKSVTDGTKGWKYVANPLHEALFVNVWQWKDI